MILYACRQRLAGGLMIRRNTLLLFWFLVRSQSEAAFPIEVPGFLNRGSLLG
jgi:hypothetical protein